MNLFFPMLVSGLLTSAHCVMMCGNMVLSYAVKGNEEGPLAQRMKPHVAYHLAKIVSYALVGLLLGSIGAFISQDARSWVSVLAGGFMVLLGLNMTGKFPMLKHIEPRPPRFLMTLLSKMRRKANEDAAQGESTLATPITFGLMTGLMPCGPLIAAQVAAAGAGSPINGSLAMLGFGLGTAPLMLGYGAFASFLGVRLKKYMAVAAAIVIIVLGIVMLNRGATALGSPVTFNTIKQSVVGSGSVAIDESQFTTGADGVVEIPLVIENVQFQPQTLAIPADKPVRLIVERREDNLCSDQLFIPSLGVQAPLVPNGTTVVELPASKAGSFQMTCQMGMMSGVLQVGAGAAQTGGGRSGFLLLVFAVTVGAGLAVNESAKRREREEAARAKRKRSGGKPAHAPQPAPGLATVFGLKPPEFLLVLGGIGVSVIAGLTLGGFFG